MTGFEKGNCSTLYVIVLLLYAVCTVCLREGLHYTLDQPVLTCTVVQRFKTLKGGEIVLLFAVSFLHRLLGIRSSETTVGDRHREVLPECDVY